MERFIVGRMFCGAAGWAGILVAVTYIQEISPSYFRGE
jgi:hypothetical protein